MLGVVCVCGDIHCFALNWCLRILKGCVLIPVHLLHPQSTLTVTRSARMVKCVAALVRYSFSLHKGVLRKRYVCVSPIFTSKIFCPFPAYWEASLVSASDAVERARVTYRVQAGPFLCPLSLASRKAAVTLKKIL